MQGVRVAPAVQDENNSQLFGPSLATQNVLQSGKQASDLKTARKAFGNITNTQARDAAEPGTATRRAFGDITNSTSKPAIASARKLGAGPTQPRAQQHAAPAVTPAQRATVAPWWKTEDPERPAGKMWEQLQADREREEQADIQQSVQQLLAGLRGSAGWKLQSIAQGYTSDEDDAPVPAPVEPAWAAIRRIGTWPPELDFSIDDMPAAADLLPDIPLPDLDRAFRADVHDSSTIVAGAMTSAALNGDQSSSRNSSNCGIAAPSAAHQQPGKACDVLEATAGIHRQRRDRLSIPTSPTRCDTQLDNGQLRSPEAMPW